MRPLGGWSARTHCKNDHEFTPENTRWDTKRKHRVCRACVRARRDKYLGRLADELRQKKAAAKAASLSGVRIDLRTRDRSRLKTPKVAQDYKPLGAS